MGDALLESKGVAPLSLPETGSNSSSMDIRRRARGRSDGAAKVELLFEDWGLLVGGMASGRSREKTVEEQHRSWWWAKSAGALHKVSGTYRWVGRCEVSLGGCSRGVGEHVDAAVVRDTAVHGWLRHRGLERREQVDSGNKPLVNSVSSA
jgi:hypothetical protein